MKRLAFFSSVLFGLTFSFSNVALAEHQDNKIVQLLAQSEEEPQSPDEFLDSLELTNEQQEQIQAILDEYQPAIESTAQELRAALQELRNTINPSASADAIRIARKEVIATQQQLSELLFERLLAIRTELTEEQREAIRERLRELAESNLSQQQ